MLIGVASQAGPVVCNGPRDSVQTQYVVVVNLERLTCRHKPLVQLLAFRLFP